VNAAIGSMAWLGVQWGNVAQWVSGIGALVASGVALDRDCR
jgi:hypothetical protein